MNATSLYAASCHFALTQDLNLWLAIPHYLLSIKRIHPFIERKPFLLQIVLCILSAAGGGTIARLLLGLRPPWIDSPDMIPWIIVCWYFLVVLKLDYLINYRFIRLPLALLDEISRARAIFTHFHLAIRMLPGEPWPGVILVATMAGSGGSYLSYIAKRVHSTKNVFELMAPGWGTYGPFVAAVTVYCSHYFFIDYLPEEVFKLAVIGLFFVQVIGSDYLGPTWIPPILRELAAIFFYLTRIEFIPQEDLEKHHNL